MSSDRTLVVGGSGFIGRGIQESAMDLGVGDSLAFSYSEHPDGINDMFKKVQADLATKEGGAPLKDYKIAIFVAGQGSKDLADADPDKDIQMNVNLFVNMMRHFRGSLVLLSSQSVYQGLDGQVSEKVDHVPQSPFGISNRMAEAYADYYYHVGWLRKLWTFRLMYAYGKGESERRLIPRCAWAAANEGKITLHGGGRSYLNPLPSKYVGEILLSAAETVTDMEDGSHEIFNLSHQRKMTVLDVVKILSATKFFEYSVEESKERWPVRYWGDTGRLENLLKNWKTSMPDARKSLVDYFNELEMKPVKQAPKPHEAVKEKKKQKVVWPV